MVARLPGATDFKWGQVKKCILNFNDCHNRNCVLVASRASDKLGGGGGKYPTNFQSLGV